MTRTREAELASSELGSQAHTAHGNPRRRLRVLIVALNYAPEITGNAPYTAGLATGLSDRGHQVRVLTGLPHYPQWRLAPGYEDREVHRREFIDSVPVSRLRHHIPTPPTGRGRIRMEASFGGRVAVTRWPSHDVLVCPVPGLLPTGLCVGRTKYRRRHAPVVTWVQDLYSLGVVETGFLSGRPARLTGALEGQILRNSDAVVAIHDSFKSHIVNNLGVRADAVEVIRNWTHLRPTELSDRNATRSRFGWRNDELIVLHAGNMGVKQGLENVVATAQLAAASHANVRFVLLGDGNQRSHLEQLGAGIPTLQFIRPLPTDDFRSAMAAADILLVNDRPGVGAMSMPSKLTSYFTTGNPVVAATEACSTTAYELAATGAGMVVPPDDPRALLDTLTRLAANGALRDTLARAGRQYSATVLSANHAIDRFETLLTRLTFQRNSAAQASKGTFHQ
nr:glycosyltransferase [Skermania sp. ID1734]